MPMYRKESKVKSYFIRGVLLFIGFNAWIILNGGLIPWFLRSEPSGMPESGLDLIEFSSDSTQGDGIQVTWAHAVNSKRQLEDAKHQNKHSIEADVVLKHEDREVGSSLPIMSHPPIYDSDITLKEFLDDTIVGKSAIKLDFKSLAAFSSSLPLIKERADKLIVPLWLNADILTGQRGTGLPPVDGVRFLEKYAESKISATLSLGWKVKPRKTSDAATAYQPYSWADINEMFQLLRAHIKPHQKVTFPISASLLHQSTPALIWLCDQFDSSLTIYQSTPDELVDIAELLYLRSKTPVNRVYYDLTPSVSEQFQQLAKQRNPDASKTGLKSLIEYYGSDRIRSSDWIIKVSEPINSDMRVSDDIIWMTGPQAVLISSNSYRRVDTLTFRGQVTFVPNSLDTSTSMKTSLQIYLFGHDNLSSHPTGIRCNVGANGRLIVTADHLPEMKNLYEDKHIPISASNCYRFKLIVSSSHIEFSVDSACHEPLTTPLHNPTTLSVDLHSDAIRQKRYPIMLRASDSSSFVILERLRMESSNSVIKNLSVVDHIG